LQLEEQWIAHLKKVNDRDSAKAQNEENRRVQQEQLIKIKERKNKLMAKFLTTKELHARKKEERFRKMYEVELKRNRRLQLIDSKCTTSII